MRRASRTRFLLAAAGLTGLFWLAATPVFAGPATDRLREFFGTVNGVLVDPAIQSRPLEKVARIKRLVTDVADVRGAAAAVLDREWQARTPAEREEFTRLFAEFLERGLVARLAGTVSPVNGMIMTWRGENQAADEVRVTTMVESRDGRKILVEYRMYERRGRWLVRDVVVDGISTIDNYRAQFRRVLRQGSYATLIAQLRAKLGEDTLMFAQPSHVPTPAEAAASRPSPAPRVAARAPASVPAPKAAAPALARAPRVAKASTPSVAKPSTPPVAKASTLPVAKASTLPVAKASTPPVARPSTPMVAKAAAPPAPATPPRAPRVSMEPVVVPPPADVLSPLSTADMTADVLPSALLLMLGFGGVSAAVYLRRRASGQALAQRFGDRHQNLVLLHPVPRVAKVREGRGKRRVVPPPRNPSRHVDDAHGA